MEIQEYLLAFGTMGDVGRFRPARPLRCRRGNQAVVQSYRGLELGVVLCPATEGHARFFVNTSVGKFLRLAGAEDEQAARTMQDRSRQLFDDSRSLALAMGLPLEILDVEVLLDGRQAILHHLRWEECEERPFISALSRQHAVRLTLHHMMLPGAVPEEADAGGCGSCGAGGCGSCGAGGCGSCSTNSANHPASRGEVLPTPLSAAPADNLRRAHFAALREKMHAHGRTPLL